jgi:hypothetical protein
MVIMGFWQIVKVIGGAGCILMGCFNKEFKPMGWTTGPLGVKGMFPVGSQAHSMSC